MSYFKIALDGPGGAGKSSVAKAVAKALGIVYVDTGAMYRTVGLAVRRRGISADDSEAISALLPELVLTLSQENGMQVITLNGEAIGDEIRTPEISMYASAVSALPAVRAFLLETQRAVAEKQSVIMDGRDIGTVIFPDAAVKIFLTASPEARAKRRYDELIDRGEQADYETVLAEMNERDHNDSTRAIAPLRPADDAVTIDTSALSFEQSVAAVLAVIREKTGLAPVGAANAPKMSRPYRILYKSAARLIRFFLRIRITGSENVPRTGGYVVCSNHIALTDVFTLGASFPRQLRYLGKKELFRIPVLAPIIRALGAIPLERKGSDVAAIKRSIELAKSGELVSVFPQGHRYPKVNPADTDIKNGVGLIAYRAGVGMLPVCIKIKKQKYALFRRVDVIIGKPLSPAELGFTRGGNAEYTHAAETVFHEICSLGGYAPSALPASSDENAEVKESEA